MIDMNGNGKIDRKEFMQVIKLYAKFLHVDLEKGWKKQARHVYKNVNSKGKGISLNELVHWL
tara:strand:- start:57 stop:242 length:186 start_codon:yes stop_codon:yes gene_type:complete